MHFDASAQFAEKSESRLFHFICQLAWKGIDMRLALLGLVSRTEVFPGSESNYGRTYVDVRVGLSAPNPATVAHTPRLVRSIVLLSVYRLLEDES